MCPALLISIDRFLLRLGRGILLLLWLVGFGIARGADNSAQSVLLSQYPLLSQKDPGNYRDQSLLTVQDSLPGGTGTAVVPNLACAATVYTMLERGRGNHQAMIDDFYPDPRKFNGNSPGATRPAYVGGDVTLDQQQILTSLKSGQPIVLHGFGGPLKEHFILAVGFKTDADGKQTLMAFDPYPGNDSDKPGKQIEISLGAMPIVHPIYSSIVFQKMRVVAGENSNDSLPNGESILMPVAYKTYTFTPGKLTGQELFLEKENLHCKIFCFDQYHVFPKPTQTVDLRISLRGGYRAHDLFGHDDFVPKEAQDVATGWVPQASGNFIIFPDESKQHLPMWIPEHTRLIRVPFVKQYGDTVVNAYDIALGLDRFNQGDDKSVSIEFKIVEATDDSGKNGKRLIPTNPLTAGVYFAYSLPDGTDTDIYGFLFAVGIPPSGTANPTATQVQPTAAPVVVQSVDAQLAREVLDYALLSQAVYDLGTDKYKAPNGWEAVGLPGLVCLLNPKKAAFIDVESGFKVSTFVKGKKLVVVFQGTNPNEAVDWTTDFFTLKGVKTAQYQEALLYAGKIIEQAGNNYDIVMAGHSLGGGLATYAALYYDKPAIVFNAAPIGSEMLNDIQDLKIRKSRVKNIDMKGDVVSGFGGQSGPIYTLEVPAAVSEQISRNSMAAGPSFAINNFEALHSMASIIIALQNLTR